MIQNSSLKFRKASTESEFEQIHSLNYKTFVEEIPQHEENPSKSLIDKFHHENTYIICVDADEIIGMVAVCAKRPFSLELKLGSIDSYIPEGHSVCEVRLLAIDENYRNREVLYGLLKFLVKYCKEMGYNLGVISGLLKHQKLYKHLAFVPFGPLVGTEKVLYQPMYVKIEQLEKSTKLSIAQSENINSNNYYSFLPGPVDISENIRNAFILSPISHRSEVFKQLYDNTKESLYRLTNSKNAEIFVGTGTLANDVIAGQLSLNKVPGLILTNGEFGERLVDHAKRFGLYFQVIRNEWGELFNPEIIRKTIINDSGIKWLWVVHCESSTGVMNDINMLKNICLENHILLCLDCISSIGTLPVNLNGVYLASCVSGKGLGSYPGLSAVFYNYKAQMAPNLPRYLDLGFYAANCGVPFTHSSNLINALCSALDGFKTNERFDKLFELSNQLRTNLMEMGLYIIGQEGSYSPAITTIALSGEISSEHLGINLEDFGYFLNFRSDYLKKRNWIQICLMGVHSIKKLENMLIIFRRFLINK